MTVGIYGEEVTRQTDLRADQHLTVEIHNLPVSLFNGFVRVPKK